MRRLWLHIGSHKTGTAIGHYAPKVLTPRSKRITVDEVLVSHEKNGPWS